MRDVGSAVSGGVGCFGGSAGFGNGANGSSSAGAGLAGAVTAGGSGANGSSETVGKAGGWIGDVRGGGETAAGDFDLFAAGAGVGIGGFSSRMVVAGSAGRTSFTGCVAGPETAVAGAGFAGSSDCRGRSEAGAGAGLSAAGEIVAAVSEFVCGAMTGADADGLISGARRGSVGEPSEAAGDVSVTAGWSVADPNPVDDAGAEGAAVASPEVKVWAGSLSTGITLPTDGDGLARGAEKNCPASLVAIGGASYGGISTGIVGWAASHDAVAEQQQRQQRRCISRQAAAGSTNKSKTVVQTNATCKAFRKRFIGEYPRTKRYSAISTNTTLL